MTLNPSTFSSTLKTCLTLCAAAVLLSACGSAVKLDDTPVESRSGSTVGGAGGAGAGAAGAGGAAGANAAGAGSGVQVKTVDAAIAGTKDLAKLPPG